MRAPRRDTSSGLNKGTWTVEEDEKLTAYINKYGIWNWCKMPPYAGLSRTGKSCRLRWMNYLKPNVKHGNFTNEEEETILYCHSVLGNKWSAIARKLPGRTDNEVKNHWHTHLKKQRTQDLVFETRPKETKISYQKVDGSVESDDHFHLSTSYDHITSSSMLDSSSKCEPEVKFETLYNMHSPGTIEDLENLWQQLCHRNEDLEHQNNGYIF